MIFDETVIHSTPTFREGAKEGEGTKKLGTVERLNGAIARYASACASLKAASTPSRSLQFASEYSKLRCEFLQCLVQLLHSCR